MTVVTDPCEIPLLAQARPMMLCINTSLPLLESVVIARMYGHVCMHIHHTLADVDRQHIHTSVVHVDTCKCWSGLEIQQELFLHDFARA